MSLRIRTSEASCENGAGGAYPAITNALILALKQLVHDVRFARKTYATRFQAQAKRSGLGLESQARGLASQALVLALVGALDRLHALPLLVRRERRHMRRCVPWGEERSLVGRRCMRLEATQASGT